MKQVAIFVLLLSCCAFAQCNCNDAPQPKPNVIEPTVQSVPSHKFMDTTNMLEFFTDASALAGEVSMSCSIPDKTCKQIAIGAAGFFVAEVGVTEVIHHAGHHELERLPAVGSIFFHVGRMIWISTHRPGNPLVLTTSSRRK